jgi:hypothetical protein
LILKVVVSLLENHKAAGLLFLRLKLLLKVVSLLENHKAAGLNFLWLTINSG